MTTQETRIPVDVEALAELGRDRVARNAAKLEQIETAIRQGVPEALIYACLAPDFDRGAQGVVAAVRWADTGAQGILVLDGKVGRGKSVAACRWAVRTGARWVTAAEVSTWDWDAATEQTRIWTEAPYLVVDELGGQGSTGEREVARLAVILAARWARLRPTLVTTNMRKVDFARVYDDASERDSRLVDRIVERGEWLTLGGPNRRTNPAALEQGRQRLLGWRRLETMVATVTAIADGYERADKDTAIQRLVDALAVTDEQLAEARAKLDARAQYCSEFAAPYLEAWEREAAEDKRQRRASADAVRSVIARYLEGAKIDRALAGKD